MKSARYDKIVSLLENEMLIDRINHDHLDSVFNAIQESLIEIDSDYCIVRMNNTAEKLFAVEASSVIGNSIFELTDCLSAESQAGSPVSFAIKNLKGVSKGQCILQKTDQTTHLCWMHSPLEYKGKKLGTLLAIIDYTDKQNLSSALAQQRIDFLAVLNHRLQTPVLAANRVIHLLLDGQFGDLSAAQTEVISRLGENMEEINRLMNMIMDIYRYRTASKELRMVDVDVKELLGRVELPDTTRIQMQIKVDCDSPSINGDPRELLRLIQHLVDNAMKYARSKVLISVRETAGSLCVRVDDDGKGIASEDIKGLFEKFYLVSASGRYAPVTGAGLCLCSEIAKAHRGRISCFSQEGHGASFEVILPLRHQEMPPITS